MYMCIDVYMNMCIYACMCMYIYNIYIYIYIYVLSATKSPRWSAHARGDTGVRGNPPRCCSVAEEGCVLCVSWLHVACCMPPFLHSAILLAGV